ncbi:GNAT family N-acetyltransferase [Novosphingobium sp. 1949]|uniref:GNAT family N-acetyltransferase n=1 Tax=Novosphingobium organovorum TaxID=2930092 RepID=A0ABT0BGP8_9SPHN|nr:GNAT family N-acetyltransferase [Novosphingobium organovorum]MCJ2184251.1 GNAT family N-acetyltransferase [Novosphingobium organovorum]
MSEPQFRAARIDDLPAIVALIVDDEYASGGDDPTLPLDPRYEAAFARIAASPDTLLVVGELEGRVVATLQLTFLQGLSGHGARRANVETVKVASDRRGRRIGAKMLAWALDRAREAGCASAQLTSNALRLDAHRFYRNLGWKQSHAGFKITL